MAPEIERFEQYRGESVDLFAAGVILFIMRSAADPFKAARESDPYFKCIMHNQHLPFWNSWEQKRGQGYYSNEFKELITMMLYEKAAHRPNITDIIGHDWLRSGRTATREEVKNEFIQRRAMIN